MIYTPHILVGAVIGAKTHNLGLIIILGIVSHILLDKITHWGYIVGPYIKNFRETKSLKSILPLIINAVIDCLIGLLIVLVVIYQKNLLHYNELKFIILGIIFSFLPDIVLTIIYLFSSPSLFKKYSDFNKKYLHIATNNEKEGKITFLGLFTQIIVVICALILFFV